MIQQIKNYLVGLGPGHPLPRLALVAYGRLKGFTVRFIANKVTISSGEREVILSREQYVQAPIVIEGFADLFRMFEPDVMDGRKTLDFSHPRIQRYAKSKIELYFPSIPEEDQIEAYTHLHRPVAGETVWDVGAHAGATSLFLSQLVGPTGKVIAFEPDETNFRFLEKNIELHDLHNVICVKKALADSTGSAMFNMDGTMCAGLSEYLTYTDQRLAREVETISFSDACAELGDVPGFVKMDIEGAEVAVIKGAQNFLRGKNIHFAIESFHRVNGELSFKPLESLFRDMEYHVESSNVFGQMFTWARR